MKDTAGLAISRLETKASESRTGEARARNSAGGTSRWNSEAFSAHRSVTGHRNLVSEPSARAGQKSGGGGGGPGYRVGPSSFAAAASSSFSNSRAQPQAPHYNVSWSIGSTPQSTFETRRLQQPQHMIHRPPASHSTGGGSTAASYAPKRRLGAQRMGGFSSRMYENDSDEDDNRDEENSFEESLKGAFDYGDEGEDESNVLDDDSLMSIRNKIYGQARKDAMAKETAKGKEKEKQRVETPEALISRLSAPFKKITPRPDTIPKHQQRKRSASPETLELAPRKKRDVGPPQRLIQEEIEEDEDEGDDLDGYGDEDDEEEETEEDENDEGSDSGSGDRQHQQHQQQASGSGSGHQFNEAQYNQLPQNIYQNFTNNGPVVTNNAPVPQNLGTLTLAKNINPFMDDAKAFFKCDTSDPRTCMGCKSRISDQTTTELQPEMAAAVEKFFRGLGSMNFFVLCEELAEHFNEVVVPIYNQRIKELEERRKAIKDGLTSKDRFVTTALRSILTSIGNADSLSQASSPSSSASPHSVHLPRDSTSPVSRSISTPSSISATTVSFTASATITTTQTHPVAPANPEIDLIFAARHKPLGKWTPRSVFDHWVSHVNSPLVQELVSRLILIRNIQLLEGLMFIELPGPGNQQIRESDSRNIDSWNKLHKCLSILNVKLAESLPTSRTVAESVSFSWSTKGTVSNAWQTSYSLVATVDDLYK